ncbi:MAG: aspartate--ammonia ligase [Cytophagales bacterium]|nr:aspartate--ammonia ligase [Cytophagales bacterium]
MALQDLIFPASYQPKLQLREIERAIKLIKDFFEQSLSSELQLRRFSAPLFVLRGTGINDDLNGVERAVSFPILDMQDQRAEVVHSLAKWKRMTLADFEIEKGYGIYTDMNAIRADEVLDNTHSIYVDQWDWEKVIGEEERSIGFLKHTVRKIYAAIKRVEYKVYEQYPHIAPQLPEQIHFISAEELLVKYPDLSPKEREAEACREYGAIFLMGIGGKLTHGEKHDGRAPDYDDWSTENEEGFHGLNGDILVWNPVLQTAYELSSMGIRVDKKALEHQLALEGEEDRKELMFHQRLLNGELPFSIGGGIGQSRLCMYFLQTAHIGEVQASLWPEEMRRACEEKQIVLM